MCDAHDADVAAGSSSPAACRSSVRPSVRLTRGSALRSALGRDAEGARTLSTYQTCHHLKNLFGVLRMNALMKNNRQQLFNHDIRLEPNCTAAGLVHCNPRRRGALFREGADGSHRARRSARPSTSVGPQYLPATMALEPWAAPVTTEWCAQPAEPRLFVVLTAAVQAFVNLARRGLRLQQRNTTERLEMYERVVRHWAVASNVAVIFAENSGADLASIEAQVPPWRREKFEFLRVPRSLERLPFRAKPDVGRLEAQSIVYALNHSKLLASRCPHDIVFGVTGRYFVHNFEHLVRRQCLLGRSGNRLPLVLVQKPEWLERKSNERESSVLGFAASFALEVHGWAVMPLAGMAYEQYARQAIGSEAHIGTLARSMEGSSTFNERICNLPPLPILPVREGSSAKYRESI